MLLQTYSLPDGSIHVREPRLYCSQGSKTKNAHNVCWQGLALLWEGGQLRRAAASVGMVSRLALVPKLETSRTMPPQCTSAIGKRVPTIWHLLKCLFTCMVIPMISNDDPQNCESATEAWGTCWNPTPATSHLHLPNTFPALAAAMAYRHPQVEA